jgi:hypothetical protein
MEHPYDFISMPHMKFYISFATGLTEDLTTSLKEQDNSSSRIRSGHILHPGKKI